jgi:hypothetical protein
MKKMASLKSLEKEVRSEVGFGSGSRSISQRYGSADLDPDPHQNVTDLQHCKIVHQKDVYRKKEREKREGTHSQHEKTVYKIVLLK